MAHNTLLTFIFIGFFFLMNSLKSQDPLGLARPRLSSSMAMITSEPPVLHADFRMEGAVLRYTTDGTVPDLHSPVMQSELKVRFPATIRSQTINLETVTSASSTWDSTRTQLHWKSRWMPGYRSKNYISPDC
ncbi:MAG: chitobiase/beta-hexosaminidase C-terminal domain-containing protein [Saprospiraceae bacterium]|nr:chitobiase/beta-hexosaminidase C-terminal domain-containing protein [Saprospiraceae bacterium]